MSEFVERWPNIFVLSDHRHEAYYEPQFAINDSGNRVSNGYNVGMLKDGYRMQVCGRCSTKGEAITACRILLTAFSDRLVKPCQAMIASVKAPHGFYSFDRDKEIAALEEGNIVIREQRTRKLTHMLLNPQEAYITFLPEIKE